MDRNARFFGEIVHGGFARNHAAPGRPGRLRVDGENVVPCGDDLAQRRHGEIRRPHIYDAQWDHGRNGFSRFFPVNSDLGGQQIKAQAF
jgi:hypothetical protein